ncbi:MAG: lysophospholipid acyltransferase family protein [Alphaproteobacteria bacterium]
MSNATTGTQALTPRYRLEGAALRILFGLFRLLGLARASAFGGWLVSRIGPRLGVSRRADRNLQHVMPTLTPRQRAQIIHDMWENLGRTIGEYPYLGTYAAAAQNTHDPLIKIEGLEHAAAAHAAGKGALFFSGHFANWEVLPLCLSAYKENLAEVYRAANNPAANKVILGLRQSHIAPKQFPKGVEGARGIVRHLKNGGFLAILTDQKLREGISADFMGHPAQTPPAAAQFALKFNAPLIPASIARDKHCFTLTIHPPLAFTPSGNKSDDVQALTQLMNDWLSAEIAKTPGHWLWLHNRWTF